MPVSVPVGASVQALAERFALSLGQHDLEAEHDVALLAPRRHHDHGDLPGGRLVFEAPADLQPVDAREHHVQEHEVRQDAADQARKRWEQWQTALSQNARVMQSQQQELIRKEESFIKKHMGSQRTAEAKGRAKKLSHVERLVKPHHDVRRPFIKAPEAARGGERVLHTEALSGGYPDNVLFEGVEVGSNARLDNCIIDKEVSIPPGETIGVDRDRDAQRFTISPRGVVVVPRGYRFGNGG